MASNIFRTVLVIGDDHEEIIKRYSLDTKVDKYLKVKFDDASKLRQNRLDFIEKVINSDNIPLSERQKDIYKDLYLDIKEMDDFEYYRTITEGCFYDEETGDAYSTTNPNAYYKYERCPQHRLEVTGEEADFSNPFKLNDGTVSYSCKMNEIDWNVMHMFNTATYYKAWDLVVNDSEPVTEQEKRIKENMGNKLSYFVDNFANEDEYVIHSCSFWTYGVATKDGYWECDYTISDKEWVATYYDRFIKNLNGNELLTLYEVRSLND